MYADINQGHQTLKSNLSALRHQKVPNYWESEQGKQFLASGENCATRAMVDLPPQQQQNEGEGDVVTGSTFFLKYLKK